MPKVLISDKLSERSVEIFERNGVEVDFSPGLSAEDLVARIGDFDGLAVRSATKVTADVLAAAPKLRVIGRAGIGVDNIDVDGATAAGVVVMNAPFGNTVTTAEHAVAMMMAMAREIPTANASVQGGKWEKSRFMGVELYNKTLGVIGVGNIGGIVADRALGMKMKVVAFDPFLSPERAADLGIEKVELDDLLARADFITVHTPLNEHTRDLIDADAIAKTRPGVRIVNCARGGIVNEAALKAALDSGHVAGAALDVFAEEPPKDNPLVGLDNVVVTPHLGASTEEAQENVALQIAEQMSAYLNSGAVTNAINMPSVSAEDAPRLRPYMTLVEQLGSFAGQLTESALTEVTVEYAGAAAELNTRPLTAVLLAALLRPTLDTVNLVNAAAVARDRDIKVSEVTREHVDEYQTLVKLTVTTERQARSVSGTLVSDRKPRLVEIKEIPIEATLGAHMLYITNSDQPGFIGRLGTLLGEAGINIATFNLGRVAPGGDALALLEVDQPLDDDTLGRLRELPMVIQAKPLSF